MPTRQKPAEIGVVSPNTAKSPFFHKKHLTFEAGFPIRRIDVHDKFLGIPVTYYVVKDPADHNILLATFEREDAARAWARTQERRAA